MKNLPLFAIYMSIIGVIPSTGVLATESTFQSLNVKFDTYNATLQSYFLVLDKEREKLMAEKTDFLQGITTCSQKKRLYSPESMNNQADSDHCVPFPCKYGATIVQHGSTIDQGCPSRQIGQNLFRCDNRNLYSYSNTCRTPPPPPPPPPPPKSKCAYGSVNHGATVSLNGGCRTMRCDDGALLLVRDTCTPKPKDCYGGAAGVIRHGQSAAIPCPSYAPEGTEIWTCNNGIGTRTTYTCHKPEPKEPEGYWYAIYKYTTCIQKFDGIRGFISGGCKYHGDWHDYECRGGVCHQPKPSPYCTVQETGGRDPC